MEQKREMEQCRIIKALANGWEAPYPDEVIYQGMLFLKDYRLNGMPDGPGWEDTPKKKLGEKVTDRVTENQALILKEMNKDNHATARLLSKFVGISERKIKENIKLLKNRGRLKRIGPDRGGHWEVVDDKEDVVAICDHFKNPGFSHALPSTYRG